MSAREVFLVGGSPWGFRMHGGHDLRQPLRISRVNPGSKAAQQGMREGDLISSINGKSAGELTNSEAHALLRNAGDTLKLGLNLENTGSPKRHRAHRSSVRESATTEIVRETTTTTTTTAAKTTTTSSTRRVTTESKKTGEANEAKVGQSSIDCRNGGLSARLEVKQRNPAKKSKTRNTLHPVDSQGLCDRSSKLDRKGKEIRMSRGIRKQGKRRGHGRRNARRCPTLVTAVEGMEKPSDSSSKDVEGVAGSQECSKRERCSIERGTTARPVVKVVEISTISSLPLEATVDHIPGVGIVESGAGGSSSEDAIVTISEPTESLRPFTTTSNDGERLEILDVSDHCHSEVTEVETVNANPVVDEADSDTATGETSSDLVPRRPTWNLRNSTSEWDSVMPRDVEAELRSFIEGLKLPSHVHDAEEALRRRACKRTRKMHQVALLHSQQSDRFLDSIQEENERISEEKQQQQQVRDFINEEISKFRRKEDVGQLERDLFYCPPAPPNRSSSLPDVPPFQETHSDDPAAPRRPSLPNCQHPLDTRDPKSGVLGNLLTMMGLSSIANSQLLVCFPGTLLGEHRHLPERERGILDEKADAREPTNRLLAIIKENSKKRSRKPTTTTLGVDRERLKVTRLCDWLTSARYEQLVGESCAILENGTVERILPLRRIKDSRYSVNPALIDGKVEERKKTAASSLVAKCVASVDKSCIDTTSIFDQSPPRSHLEPRRHVNGEVETKAKMSAIPVNGEVFRQLMYNEYVDKVLEREKRKQLKTLRLSSPESALKANNWPEKRSACSVEGEFMEKARTRLNRIGIKLDDEEVGKETRLTEKMPKHLQEFLGVSGDDENVMFAPTFKASSAAAGIWSPNTDPPIVEKERSPDRRTESQKDVEIPAIWTPPSVAASPVSGRKEFRPVPFESPTLSRKKPAATRQQESEGSIKESAAVAVVELTQPPPPPPPWMTEGKKRETSTQDSSGSSLTSRLPRVQNPTITLLQKAREGQLPKGASYLAEREQEEEVSAAKGCLRDGGRPVISPADIIYTVKKEYESEPETENESPRKMVDLGPRKFEGIGPTSKEGIPLVLRSEVKETNQTKWYKKMYDSLHRADRSDDYVTVRYKPTRANRHGYGSGSSSGYLSEPDYRLYSSDLLRSSSTLDNRHCTRNKRNEFSASSTVPRRSGLLRYSPEVYKNQPGRIEDYEPGRSSITEKEAKEWWDEVMDIFDGPFDQRHVSHRPTKPYMAHALKESGYESDSTLVFKRKEDISPLNEFEQRLAYKSVQSGGDVPLHGLRKPAPERPKDNADVKYFQVSPTLMRIHVHRKTVPVVSSSTRKQGVATTTKIRETRVVRTRTSPKANASKKASTAKPPPSPPERLSSRNSKTLDMYASRGKRIPGKAKSSKESTVSCDCRSLSCPKRANVRGRLTRKEQEESSRRLTKSSVGRKTGASTLGEAKPTSRKAERGQQRSRTVVGASTSKPKDVSIKSNDVKRQKGKVSNGGSGREKTKKAEETRQLSPASLTNMARTENVSRIVRSTRSEASLKSLIVYLAQKRPVSNSIFRSWERKRSLSEPSRTSSLRSLQVRSGREEYRRYVLEMLHEGRKSGRGSERYKQLFDYYSSLERLGELERTFSTGDLRTIGGSRNKRTVDYDRWKATRSREKAESEYTALHVKLSAAQKERNFLFSAKQTSKFKWQESRELRCKDRSVDDIVQRFNKLQSEDGGGLVTGKKWQTPRDTYKPLWRGRSVLNVANALQRKAAEEKESKLSLRQNLGGSKMFWSSLSSEQVATLKRQLNEIYGSDNLQRLQAAQKPRNLAKFEIVVPTEAKSLDDVRGNARKLLHVRCHSMSASEVPPSPMIEMDRKKLSVSLGREAMERISQRANLFPNRETEDAMKMDSGADVASKIEFFEGAIPKGRNVDGLSGTQSFADLRELFGETESAKYATPFLLEKVRTRSPSPARHWRSTCLRSVKNGAVKRLSARFESMEELSMHERRAKPMRFRSDPELARERQRTPILCEILSSDSRRSRRSSCRDNGRSLSSPADLAGTRRRIGDRVDKVVTESANVTSSPPPPPKYERHAHDCHPESPRRYVEGEVTIHYRSPVRTEAKEVLSEEELARRSAENMRRVYQEERRRKYMQELHDIDSRRHTDNFTPSQKSPIPLNRYDDVVNELHPIHGTRSADQTPEPRLVARALYNFTSQSPRELNFRRGDVIFIRRRVDKNWYEGEHNAMIGLFPSNYVEILPYESARTAPKKPYEGQARAKFNFVAQTKLELSLAKGELVILTRRVDENWYEGRIGNRKGIFPVSYVEAITEPGHGHLLTNGSTGGGKTSTTPHRYPLPINANQSGQRQHYNSLPRMGSNRLQASHLDQALHINTHLEPVAYRALYRYRPQNEDELELDEGDTVYVMEKCDDGWYVGSSQRTGCFGTFPGNYVEQL